MFHATLHFEVTVKKYTFNIHRKILRRSFSSSLLKLWKVNLIDILMVHAKTISPSSRSTCQGQAEFKGNKILLTFVSSLSISLLRTEGY